MNESRELLEQIAQAAQLREGLAGVAALLRQLFRQSPLATAELARHLGWPVPVTAAVRRELERAGLVERTPQGSALSAAGLGFVRDVLGLSGQYDPLCPTCVGRRVVVDYDRWGDILNKLEAVHQANPTVDTTLDQSHGTPETALLRALTMYREGALEGKDVLILGDDDLVSVAVGLLGRRLSPDSGLVRRLMVADVDGRFLQHIASAGRDLGFSVTTLEHDLREPLPESLGAAFDTVETDPPYTLPGLALFLSRALQGLRPGPGRDVFLSYAPRDPEGQRDVVAACLELGFAPLAIIPAFNRYVGSATLGGIGQFLHLRTTELSRPSVSGRYDGPLYTLDLRPARRVYHCQGCAASYTVGPEGDFPTIEVLKAQRCPQCGGATFRAGRRIRHPQTG